MFVVYLTMQMALAALSPPEPGGTQNPGTSALDALERCAEIRDDAERLACLDMAGRQLAAARRTGDVVAVDGKRIRREGAANLGLGRSVDPADTAAGVARRDAIPRSIDDRIAAVRPSSARGTWLMTLGNGQQWVNNEAAIEPIAGDTIRVTTTITGGYRASIGRRTAVSVRRVR